MSTIFTHLLEISINNHPLLYIRINNYPLLYIYIHKHIIINIKSIHRSPKIFTMIPIKCFKKILLPQYKKLLLFFFSLSIRMTGNSINFDDKKFKKVTSTTKTKKYLI